ncbi:MAG: flagellar motor switch protein FliN [Hyphomicrobiaceae bacterium]
MMSELKSEEHQVASEGELPHTGRHSTEDGPTVQPNISSFEGASGSSINSFGSLGALGQISVPVEIVLGTTRMSIKDLLQIGRGAVIQLDRKVGEPIDVMVNDRLVARGELVVIDEETSQFGVKITGIVAPV